MKVKNLFGISDFGKFLAVPIILYVSSTAYKVIYNYKVLKRLKKIENKL